MAPGVGAGPLTSQGFPHPLLEKGGDASTCFVCCVDGVGSVHRMPGAGPAGALPVVAALVMSRLVLLSPVPA